MLRYADGRERRAYVSHDTQKTGAGDDAAYGREAAILRALSGPLKGRGIETAPYIAAVPESRALITGLVPGQSNFNAVKSPEDRRAIAHDYMRQIAALHALDVARAPIDGLGPVRPPSETVPETIGWLRARDIDAGSDPLVLLVLDWLERNIPADPERIVVVHGDAGPANFLFEGDRVTAVLDWELVHYGDPMADLAMICLRTLFQPFISLPDAFAAYEAAGGAPVDLDRVRYYRLLFQLRFSGNAPQFDTGKDPPPAASWGLRLLTSVIHRDVMVEALAELAGIPLAPVVLPDCRPGRYHHSFGAALADLQDVIVPRVADEQAGYKAKSVARLVKWWRSIERYGAAFEAVERSALSQALGAAFAGVDEGRTALGDAILARRIDDAAAIRLCHLRTTIDRTLLHDALGGLADSRFKPLE